MKATDARKLSNLKPITLAGILSGIKESAEKGFTINRLPNDHVIDDDVIPGLINLGYSVRKHYDSNIGIEFYFISW